MKIIPVKFIIILSLICILIFPICFYLIGFLVFYLLTLGNSVVPFYFICVPMGFGILFEFFALVTPEFFKLIIENGVTTLGSQMFSDCVNLKKITIPSTITNVYFHVFENSGLEEIYFEEGLETISFGLSLAQTIFEICKSIFAAKPQNKKLQK